MQGILAVVFGQSVFHAVEGEGAVRNPVGVASHDRPEIWRVHQISVEVIVAQDNIRQLAFSVRHPHGDDDSAISHGPHFQAVGIRQGVQIDRLPVCGFAKRFFANLKLAFCHRCLLRQGGGNNKEYQHKKMKNS